MTINDLKPLTSKSSYEEIKKNFDILYLFTEYSENFLKLLPEDYFKAPASCRYHSSHYGGLLLHSSNVALLMYRNLNEMRESQSLQYLNNMTDEEFNQYLKEAVFAGLYHDLVKIDKYIDEEDATDKQIEYALGLCKELNLEIDLFNITDLGKKSISDFIEKAKILLNEYKNNDDMTEEYFIKKAGELADIKRVYEYNKEKIDIGHSEESLVRLAEMGILLTDHQKLCIRFHMCELDVLYQIELERRKIQNYTNTIPMLRSIILAEKITGFTLESY